MGKRGGKKSESIRDVIYVRPLWKENSKKERQKDIFIFNIFRRVCDGTCCKSCSFFFRWTSSNEKKPFPYYHILQSNTVTILYCQILSIQYYNSIFVLRLIEFSNSIPNHFQSTITSSYFVNK